MEVLDAIASILVGMNCREKREPKFQRYRDQRMHEYLAKRVLVLCMRAIE